MRPVNLRGVDHATTGTLNCMSRRPSPERDRHKARYQAEVAAYVSAGGNEKVQRVITAVHGLHRMLEQWYTAQLADLDLTSAEWAVISQIATAKHGEIVTPSVLATTAAVAPSSMTHRLDKMAERGLITRDTDESNRTRIVVGLTRAGWEMFRQVVRDSDALESDALSALTERQREHLATLLERAIAGIDEEME